MSRKLLTYFLALIGVLAAVPGLLAITLSLTGSSFAWGIVTFAGEFVFWRGLILIASGVLFLSAINEGNPVQKRAQAVLASLMIWIVGGVEILSMVLSSVPGEGKRWLTYPGRIYRKLSGTGNSVHTVTPSHAGIGSTNLSEQGQP